MTQTHRPENRAVVGYEENEAAVRSVVDRSHEQGGTDRVRSRFSQRLDTSTAAASLASKLAGLS